MTATAPFPPVSLAAPALSCIRGETLVFEGLDLSLEAGAALILRGPNGAGKSTALAALAGHIPLAGGDMRWTGLDPERPAAAHIHFIGHLPAVQRGLTAGENLAFWSAVYGGDPARLAPALAAAGLGGLADLSCAVLSAGQIRRLALARLAAVARPVWLLDEPTAALDAQGADWVRELVAAHLDAGGLAVIATHLDLGLEGRSGVRQVVLPGRAP